MLFYSLIRKREDRNNSIFYGYEFYFSYFRLRWGSDILVSYLSLPNNLKKKCKKNHKNIILNFFKQS